MSIRSEDLLSDRGRADLIRSEEVFCCPLCRNEESVSLYRDLQDCVFNASGNWCFAHCRKCGLVYLNPRPIEDDIHKAYSSYYTHEIPSSNPISPKTLMAFLKDLIRWPMKIAYRPVRRTQRALSRMCLSSSKNGKLLDVGCGDGSFLKRMSGMGWEPFGVEFDGRAAQQVRDSFGISVHVGTLKSGRFPDNFFDAITMSHVVEHLYDPIDVLVECKRILKPGGKLVIATPNVESLGHRLFKKDWRGLEPPRHIQIFSYSTMKLCITKAGFVKPKIWTTGARADYPFYLGSMQVRESNKDVILSKRNTNHRIPSLIFQAIELFLNSISRRLGEELVVTVIK